MICETLQGLRLTVVHCALAADGCTLMEVNPRWSDAAILDLFAATPGGLIYFGHLHERRFNTLEVPARDFIRKVFLGL